MAAKAKMVKEKKMAFKLGKLAPKVNSKTLKFSDYLAPELAAPPASAGWEHKIPADGWGMMGNDTIGDCTCACVGHMIMNWTSNTSSTVTLPDSDIIGLYSAVTGYVPGDPSTDNGAAITDVLAYWQSKGVTGSGDKILGWLQIDQTNLEHVKQGVFLFGAVDIGVVLPNIAQTQFSNGQPWEVVADDGGVDGGHCIPVFGYNSVDGGTAVTWGQTQPFSWAWFQKYCDEAYVTVSQDWIEKNKYTPNGFNVTQLEADLKAIGQ